MSSIVDITDVLLAYLSDHEREIAQDVDDYGRLSPVFEAMFGHKPRGNPKVKAVALAVEREVH